MDTQNLAPAFAEMTTGELLEQEEGYARALLTFAEMRRDPDAFIAEDTLYMMREPLIGVLEELGRRVAVAA
ncbi:hypothetical protein [Microbacterium arabinogalactanolyticum]|uniref:hypothetical protein n=1 Tax=Microbacterium arabinogalactanolyticum TaxID=69365 RepID=UPI0025557BB5|nr:hypothetical protein [Microbacterium arabinogalactanolyticum]GLC84516.1 hypothetical protein MIAR_11040 [Microbacterium arabinogalactanolyticum]